MTQDQSRTHLVSLLSVHAMDRTSLARQREALDLAERRLVLAAYRSGMTLQEIADAMLCSVKPVRRHILAARADGEQIRRPVRSNVTAEE